MHISKEFALNILKCLGTFVWLSNNLHNYNTQEFKIMLTEAFEHAKETYNDLSPMINW